MLDNITINTQSSIRIATDKIIYFDPFKIESEAHDADYIFITHDHYDHFDLESIKKIIKEDTIVIFPDSMFMKIVPYINRNNARGVNPNEEYNINGLLFSTIPSYNLNKDFHPKANKWVGYLLELEDQKVLVTGDTDATEELLNTKCDIAFVPIGGTYTMTYEEAAKAINTIKPKVVIPTHYGSIVGNKSDEQAFANLLHNDIECVMKVEN